MSLKKPRVARSIAIDVSGSRRRKEAGVDRPGGTAEPIVLDPTMPATSPTDRVRHRFAISHAEFELLSVLKARMSWIDRPTKRGELLRAGLVALASLSDAELKDAVDRLPKLTAGQKKRSGHA